MTGDVLERLRADLGLRRQPGTVAVYLSMARTILTSVGPELDRDSALRFLDRLVREKKSASYMSNVVNVMRVMARVQGVDCPIQARDLPRQRRQVEPPVLAHDEIARMVSAARADTDLPATAVAYLALATVYGLRRMELTQVDVNGSRITVQTLKGGARRQHKVPSLIAPYLFDYQEGMPESSTSALYHRIRRSARMKTRDHDGWHAIRRGLITGLVGAGLGDQQLKAWIGWHERGGWNPVGHYYRPNMAELDEQVFAVHPFLDLWR